MLYQRTCGQMNRLARTTTGTRHRWMSTVLEDSYQFLQRSRLPTYHFQKSLPRLPIPELGKTAERYLAAVRPILDDKAYSDTTKCVQEFESGIGKVLQEKLIEHDKNNKHTSYISAPWFEMYLKDRVPLPINYNPFMMFNGSPKKEYNAQNIRATNMLVSSLRFLKSLRSQVLEPEVFHLDAKKSDTSTFRTVCRMLPPSLSWYGAYLFKAFPLDMSQYPSLFNSTRIPSRGIDHLYRDESARHILVMRGGHFYTFDVLDESGNIIAPEDILASINQIISDERPKPDFPIGVFTTFNRDSWADARQHLESIGNAEAMRIIDSSLFNICLDDWTAGDLDAGEQRVNTLRNYLHSDGKNRWFDKSFSLLFSRDGQVAVNFEHSWGDGVAVLRYLTEVYKDSTEKPRIHPDTRPGNSRKITCLEFKIDDHIKAELERASQEYSKLCNSLDMNILEHSGLGKKLCKSASVSPDSVMQLGFQVAFHRQHGKFVGTYESCSTAAFRHGRTETMRPCTVATKAFAEALNSKDKASRSTLHEMLKKCSQTHGQLTKDAAMGQGFDRHMFGLRFTAERNNVELPAVYKDPAYSIINHNILSTSTLSSPYIPAGGFGAVVKDGYGIGYSIAEDSLGCVVTSYLGFRDGPGFIECLRSSFTDIRDVIFSTSK